MSAEGAEGGTEELRFLGVNQNFRLSFGTALEHKASQMGL